MKRHSHPPLEVLRYAFDGIAGEMGKTLNRSAYTVVIKDLNDYSCALFDAEASLVAQGNNMPTHLGSMGHALADLIDFWGTDISPGDVFISNDPYRGGQHLPDVHIFIPVFAGSILFAWAGNIAHHGDWGGRVAGSISVQNRSIFEEGVCFPHVRLESAGRPNRDVYELISSNIRQPSAGLGDLRAQVAAARSAVRRTQELLVRYDLSVLQSGMRALLNVSESRTRAEIAAMPDGLYTAEGMLDGNGLPGSDALRIAAQIQVAGEEIVVTFEGTAPQQETAINIPAATTRSAVMFGLRTLLDPSIPATSGCYRPLRIEMPEHSLVNPNKPAPVSDRHLTSQRLADVLLQAFSKINPELAAAGWFVGAPWMSCFARNPQSGEDRMLLLNLCGGAGATSGHDGQSAVDPHMANATLIPAEVVELEYPIRVETYRLRPGSGGAGAHRGGDGLHAEFTNIGETAIDIQTGMEQTAPSNGAWGLLGGEPGLPGAIRVRHAGSLDGEVEIHPRSMHSLQPGDMLEIDTGGGGGYGTAVVHQAVNDSHPDIPERVRDQ
jgi:N-methylhydantoinase B